MRKAQKEYFKKRTLSALQNSKALEAEIDTFQTLKKLYQCQPPTEITVPVPPTWDFPQRDDKYIRESNGLLRKLYRRRIAACGDAVIPTITEYLFRALVEFDKAKQHV